MALPEFPDDRRASPRRFPPVDDPSPVRATPEAQPLGWQPVPLDGPPPPAVPASAAVPPHGGRPLPVHRAGPLSTGPLPATGSLPTGAQPTGSQPTGSSPTGDGLARRAPHGRAPGRPDAADDEPTVVHGRLIGEDADVASGSDDVPAEAPGRHRRRAGVSPDSHPSAEQGGRAGRSGRRRRSSFWRELPLLIVVALVLTFLIQTFLAKVYVIPSGSMESTLHGCAGCNNDRVLVDKVTYRFTAPGPGDVVVFRGPDSWTSEVTFAEPTSAISRGLQQFGSLIGIAPPDEKDFVKRVIAVGGQTVQCCDTGGRVMVDGQPLEEPYIYYLPEAGPAQQEAFGPITVPAGQLWMMGDSRNNSADSRVPDHGPVPVENVIGQARLVVLPFTRFGWIDAVDPSPTALGLPAPGDAGAPLALGVLGALPLGALQLVELRSRRRRAGAGLDRFLPARHR